MTAETFKPEDIRGAIYQAHVKTELGADDVVYVEAMNEHEAVSAAYDVNNTVVEVIDVYRVDDPKPVAAKMAQRLEAIGDQRTERQTAVMNQLMEDKAAAARTDALDRQWREASDGADQTAQEWLDRAAPTETASPAAGRFGGSYFAEAPDPNFSWGPDGEPRNWDETSRSWVTDPAWDGVNRIDDGPDETSHAVARAREALAELASREDNEEEYRGRWIDDGAELEATVQGEADVR